MKKINPQMNKKMFRYSTICIIYFLMLILNSCKYTDNKSTGNTGLMDHEIEQPQIMYNQQVYYYYATGFDDILPENYLKVGEVKTVNNKKRPTENFMACRLNTGQAVYADVEQDISNPIYLQYEGGYAQFYLKQDGVK